VPNPVKVPVAPPPAPPLPYLVDIKAEDHPDASPGFARITFSFHGAFPEYRFSYVSRVLSEPDDRPVRLSGNSTLRIVFVNAQAHVSNGASTIRSQPDQSLGLPDLVSFAPAGDIEGRVTYGLGIDASLRSHQMREIRTGQVRKPDGMFEVSIDVRHG
jgi:hypothetical protein